MYDGHQVGDTLQVEGVELTVGWRAVHPDLRSSRGYRWPFPGQWAESSGPYTTGDPCPQHEGDGICVALSWAGAASGGIPAICGLLVGYRPDDVLGSDATKVRVKRAYVLEVIDPPALLRAGCGHGAYLARANLARANLTRANLAGADLDGANLNRADLYRANLTGANLTGANLYGADLDGANLYGANLYRANLNRAVGVPGDARVRGAIL